MVNYYCCFIVNFVKIVIFLNLFLFKEKKWEWIELCQNVFEIFKDKFIIVLVLFYFDLNRLFMFICDVFDILIGYVLGQLNEENKEYVVVYGGKFFFFRLV